MNFIFRVIIDASGGDNAPLCILKGCELALKENKNIEIICVGYEEKLKQLALDFSISLNKIKIINAPDVISFNDPPIDIIKKHSNCSMAVGLKQLAAENGDVFISAGNTGALVIGSSFIVKRKPGIKCPAISTIFPSQHGNFMLIDSGANYNCSVDMLEQFAYIGSGIMQKMFKIEKPKVGILNIGKEPSKGTELQKSVYNLLLNKKEINFVGNIEPYAAFWGECDVLLADGFNGNIFLKSAEAINKFLLSEIKNVFKFNFATKIAGFIVKKKLSKLKERLNPSSFGGAPLVGLLKPVMKAHGNSDEIDIKNAILQSMKI